MPKLADLTALQLRQWLIARGHKPSKVNAAALRWQRLDDRKAALDALHRASGPHAGRKDRG